MPFRKPRIANFLPGKAPRVSFGDSLARGLAVAYPTNEGGGGYLYDALRPAIRTMALSGGPAWGPAPRSGKALALSGGSLQYAQNSSMVGLPNAANQQFSVAQWMAPATGLSALAGFWVMGTTAALETHGLINFATGICYWNNIIVIDSGYNWTFDTWQLVTLVFDGTNLIFYKNATQLGAPHALTVGATLPNLTIGNAFGVANNSRIGPTYIWRRGLQPSEVARLYSEAWHPFYFPRMGLRNSPAATYRPRVIRWQA